MMLPTLLPAAKTCGAAPSTVTRSQPCRRAHMHHLGLGRSAAVEGAAATGASCSAC